MKKIEQIQQSVIFIILVLLCQTEAYPCTAIHLAADENNIAGVNLDWPTGDGIVVINRRGVLKTAISDPDKSLNPAKWESVYGSVTFNLFGCDWPWSGMNEAGLFGCGLLLPQTRYPIPDERPSLFMKQWLQYQLDNYKSLDEVLNNADAVRIRPIGKGMGLHFLFADRSGDCAVIEFLDHQRFVYHRTSLPIRVLTNEPYHVSVNVAKRFKSHNDKQSFPYGDHSHGRFLKAAYMLGRGRAESIESAVDNSFQILHAVAVEKHKAYPTQWRIVYDIKNAGIHFQTLKNSNIRCINMNSIDFNCRRSISFIDIHESFSGNISDAFKPLTQMENRQRFEKAFKKNPFRVKVYEERLKRLADYPGTFRCD